jgi:Domain of unknown function (DUF4398)
MFPRRFGFAVALAASLLATECGQPPDKEMQDAQRAIDSAHRSGADVYATDEISAARDALKRAHAAAADRDYRLALNDALDSRERAQTAEHDATAARAAASAGAQKAVDAALASLAQTSDRLKTAEAAHVSARSLADARQTIADIEHAVQEARAATERGDYRGATTLVARASDRLSAVNRELDAAIAATNARGRR